MTHRTFHKGKYYVTFKRGFDDCKKDITIAVEKFFENDALKITLSDEEDPMFLCNIIVTRCDYEDLKKQQGLLIDFDNFPSQLVRLLEQCASNNMFLIMQMSNPLVYYFEIVEHNEFKRLVHLSLKTGPGNDNDVKQHMADSILNLKKTLATVKSSAASSEVIWNDKCLNMERKIMDLTHAVSKMEEDKIRRDTEFQELIKQEKERLNQDRLQWQRNSEMTTKAQITSSQEIMTRKDKQIEELNALCKQLRENTKQLENQLSDKMQRLNLLEKEVQKAHIEVATLQAKNTTLDRDILEKEKQISHLSSQNNYLEKVLKDNSDNIKELNSSLQGARREKLNLEERLAISESLANKNNLAANTSAEQLLKANQIISKQNSELIETKDKLLCRTAIVLEQEKVIEHSNQEIEMLKSRILESKNEMDKVKLELDSMREKYENYEKTLRDKEETIKNNNMVIQWLHKKIEETCPPTDMPPNKQRLGIQTASSSTPYLRPRNSHENSSQAISEESINFYATSKVSSLEDSSQPDIEENNGKVGLDPKYLKPTEEQNVVGDKTKGKPNIAVQNQKGKENKNVELPRVDYREKKSARSSTYRATPVSAYFN